MKNILATLTYVVWNTHERRLRAFIRVALFGILMVLIQIAVTFGVLFFTHSGNIFSFQGMIFLSLVSIFVALLIVARFIDRVPIATYGFHLSRNWWFDAGFGLILGTLLMTLIFLVEWVAGWVHVTGMLRGSVHGTPFVLAMLQPLFLFIAVGTYEEVLMRGYLLSNIAQGLNYHQRMPRGAIIVSYLVTSLVFGVLHINNPHATIISTANIALAGILLGMGYILTGELALPVGLHISWNFAQGHLFGFPVSGNIISEATLFVTEQSGNVYWTGGNFGPEAGMVGIGAIVFGTLLIVGWVRLRYGTVALHIPIAHHTFPSSDK